MDSAFERELARVMKDLEERIKQNRLLYKEGSIVAVVKIPLRRGGVRQIHTSCGHDGVTVVKGGK